MQKFITHIKDFNFHWTERHQRLINNPRIAKTGADYIRSVEKSKVDIGFNLFKLISNTYHQENFHSDILKAFLQNTGHNEGNIYLHLFLEYLNTIGAEISLAHYTNPEVFRETGKIDIMILDKVSNKAIIVENKINNAPDMPRQLPRYVEYVQKERGFKCDCIVYISLNKTKIPSKINWSKEEIDFIDSKTVFSKAYDNTGMDLYSGWISKAEKITNNIDALLILRQYGALLKKLGGNIMNKVIVEKFYEEMLVTENFKTAQSVKVMLDDLILFRAERIAEYFKYHLAPFNNILVWQSYVVAMLDYFEDNHNWSIDIGIYEAESRFEFWDRNSTDPQAAKDLLQKMNVLDSSFYESGQRMKKKFNFPEQEQQLIEYVLEFKIKLIEATKK